MRFTLAAAVLTGLTFAAEAPSTEALARRVVGGPAGVKEDDLVVLKGTLGDAALMEDLAVAVRKVGAHPLLTLTGDTLKRRMIADIPEKFDSQTPKLDLLLAKTATVWIETESTDEGAQLGLPPSRLAAQQKAAEVVGKTLGDRNVRTVYLGNGLYPTEARAKRFGLGVKDLRSLYESGLSADPAELTRVGNAVKKTLVGAKELHLTSPGGTDLNVGVKGRPVIVSDGVLTPEKIKAGGADVTTYLPAGEVMTTPAKGSGTGVVVADDAYWEGTHIKGLRLEFKDGSLVKLGATSGGERLEKMYAAAGKGKELLGAVDVGINPAVKLPKGGRLVSYVASGTVSVALGNNTWAGGDNGCAFGITLHLSGATLKADGKTVVTRGKVE